MMDAGGHLGRPLGEKKFTHTSVDGTVTEGENPKKSDERGEMSSP